jgi:hypothetical protein
MFISCFLFNSAVSFYQMRLVFLADQTGRLQRKFCGREKKKGRESAVFLPSLSEAASFSSFPSSVAPHLNSLFFRSPLLFSLFSFVQSSRLISIPFWMGVELLMSRCGKLFQIDFFLHKFSSKWEVATSLRTAAYCDRE